MTDQEPTPAEQERVRRLLAEARHREPMPAEVVARLDATLAELAASPAPVPATPAVASLAARRRRRATGLLVAAAAVTVVGLGVPTILPDLGGSGDGGSADSVTADREGVLDGGAEGRGTGPTPTRGDPPEDEASPGGVRVRPERFRQDVRELARAASGVSSDLEAQGLLDCGGYQDWGEGVAIATEYGGRAGVLVFRTPDPDGSRRVDLFLCGVPGPVRTVVLAAPTP